MGEIGIKKEGGEREIDFKVVLTSTVTKKRKTKTEQCMYSHRTQLASMGKLVLLVRAPLTDSVLIPRDAPLPMSTLIAGAEGAFTLPSQTRDRLKLVTSNIMDLVPTIVVVACHTSNHHGYSVEIIFSRAFREIIWMKLLWFCLLIFVNFYFILIYTFFFLFFCFNFFFILIWVQRNHFSCEID